MEMRESDAIDNSTNFHCPLQVYYNSAKARKKSGVDPAL